MKKTILLIVGFIIITLSQSAEVRAEDTPPWQRFVIGNTYTDDIHLYGRSRASAEIAVEITKSGGDKEGEYRYSTDGGGSWSEERVIKTGSDIALVTTGKHPAELGVKLRFSSGISFEKGRIYKISAPATYETVAGTNVGSATVRFSSDEIIYNDSYDLSVKITKSGACGEAMFSYSDGGKAYSGDILIPKSGIIKMYDGRITLTFWDGSGRFLVGDEYRCQIKGDMSKRDYTPYIFGIIGAVFFALFVVFNKLSGMRDKPDNYVLCEYKRVEMLRNNALPKRSLM